MQTVFIVTFAFFRADGSFSHASYEGPLPTQEEADKAAAAIEACGKFYRDVRVRALDLGDAE